MTRLQEDRELRVVIPARAGNQVLTGIFRGCWGARFHGR
jgi:hypothetical protein